ncbi:hypothetical protein E2C01_102514 [Portunus trituberculatus]|uniref:Uncharacterized protein n=1 Tax=Portunus trituberculatus TaxID=210409 RepID=A0A5B7KHI4_PORTR|nr:hypothetical protein [Portunus trituberculatus]
MMAWVLTMVTAELTSMVGLAARRVTGAAAAVVVVVVIVMIFKRL